MRKRHMEAGPEIRSLCCVNLAVAMYSFPSLKISSSRMSSESAPGTNGAQTRLKESTNADLHFVGPLSVHPNSISHLIANTAVERTQENALVNDFGALFQNHELADVKLNCGCTRNPKTAIVAHRAILAARSQYFLRLFKEALQIIADSPLKSSGESAPGQLQQVASRSDPISAASPKHIGNTPFLGQEDMGEMLSSGGSPSSMLPNSGSWTLGSEDLEDVSLSKETPNSESSIRNPTPYGATSMLSQKGGELMLSTSETRTVALSSGFSARMVSGLLEIDMPFTSYEAMLTVVQYLYSLRMELTSQRLVGVYALAHTMHIKSVEVEVLAMAKQLYTTENIVSLLMEVTETPNCESLLETMLAWIGDNPSRGSAILNSEEFKMLPIDLVFRMMSMKLFEDEFEFFQKFVEHTSGEQMNDLLKHLNFFRMSPEQLLRIHKTGKVKDSVVIEAFSKKIREGQLTYRVAGGSSILLEIPIFREARSPSSSDRLFRDGRGLQTPPHSPSYHEIPCYPTASSHSRTAVSGISPASLIRRRSVAVTVPTDISDLGLSSIGSETWTSESFQVHFGNWSALVKTRGGMLYKVGLVLNHTTTDCDRIFLDTFSLLLESTGTTSPQSYSIEFMPTSFTMGKEVYKHVDNSISNALGFQFVAFKRPERQILHVRVQFPVPSRITHHILD